MKRLFIFLTATFILSFTAKAMDYESARSNALFLTDKMAYELNLTPEQYDRVYQINLDYFMSLRTVADCDGIYWRFRNTDLRYILFDWQYTLYTTIDYFFRPIRWIHSSWYFPVFNHYRRGYYYFKKPIIYHSYRGVDWRRRGHNDRSPYHGHTFTPGRGMRDNYHGHTGSHPMGKTNFGRTGHNKNGNRISPNKNDHSGKVPPKQSNRPSTSQREKEPNKIQSPNNRNKESEKNRPQRNFSADRNFSRNKVGDSSQPTRNNTQRPSRTFGR